MNGYQILEVTNRAGTTLTLKEPFRYTDKPIIVKAKYTSNNEGYANIISFAKDGSNYTGFGYIPATGQAGVVAIYGSVTFTEGSDTATFNVIE